MSNSMEYLTRPPDHSANMTARLAATTTPSSRAAYIMSKAYAPTTMSARRRVTTGIQNLGPLDQWNAVNWIASQQVTYQTMYSYAGIARTILRQTGLPTGNLEIFVKGLASLGATVPTNPALPLSPTQLLRLLQNTPDTPTRLCFLLMWKAAARYTETASLLPEDFIHVECSRITIYWARKTKTTRMNPYTLSMYTTITGQHTDWIAMRIATIPNGRPITTRTLASANDLIRSTLGEGYSTHSIKHGACTLLFKMVAKGLTTLQDVAILAKHKAVTTTLRYVGHEAAQAVGTSKTTALLEIPTSHTGLQWTNGELTHSNRPNKRIRFSLNEE